MDSKEIPKSKGGSNGGDNEKSHQFESKPPLQTSYKSSIAIDTNNPGQSCITYKNVDTTDYYRKGRPYKLFRDPSFSQAKVKFSLERRPMLGVTLMLNHCRTSAHGKIDIIINDVTLVTGFQEARWDNFGEQNFNIPQDCLHQGENKLKIVLNSSSSGVYWLSDLRLDIEYA